MKLFNGKLFFPDDFTVLYAFVNFGEKGYFCGVSFVQYLSYILDKTKRFFYMEKIKESEKQNLYVNSPVEQRVLEKNGYSIYYFVSGSEEGETIVFLHPAFGDHQCFDGQIDYFSRKFRVITVDMLGHGLSRVGKSKDKIASTAIHVAEILDKESIEKAHLIGVSLGSLLAQDFALKYPEKTRSLTVLGGYNINKEQKEVAKAQRGEMFRWLSKVIFSMDAFRRYAASTTAIVPAAQARFYESAQSFTRKSFTVMSGLDKLIADRPDVRRNYPLLLLSGEKDMELAVNQTRQWHEDDTENHMYIIENAGHCANMDNPEKFNEILMKFLCDE
ncbi:MAG: alpha/beta hydrolase [Prevotellaceae bacterium]|jgi:pimeloyl-ACP methyl ester carboxylesterase|nr:alpha/beta hydrolase [Prevotellaceae bacterium]